MVSNEIIMIIPNMYIGISETLDFDYLDENNIKNIISIGLKIPNTVLNQLVLQQDETEDINFELVNDFIINSFLKNESIIICEINYNYSLYYACAFLQKYLKINFLESISFINSKIKNIKNEFSISNKIYLQKLFDYYKKN